MYNFINPERIVSKNDETKKTKIIMKRKYSMKHKDEGKNASRFRKGSSCFCLVLVFMLHIMLSIHAYWIKTNDYIKLDQQVRRDDGNKTEYIGDIMIAINKTGMERKKIIMSDARNVVHYSGESNRIFTGHDSSKYVKEISSQVKRMIETDDRYRIHDLSESRIAAFGTSRTWGNTLVNRTDAYPYLLSSKVSNFAIRGSDARYPSICTKSMVSNSIYDVIIVEYDRIGKGLLEYVETLLKRLRQRYPDATIIFMNMWLLWDIDVVKPDESKIKLPAWMIGNMLKFDHFSKILDFAKNSSVSFDFSTSYYGRHMISKRLAKKYNLMVYSWSEQYRSSAYTENMLISHFKHFSDFLHWNKDGHSLIATDIKNMIKDANAKKSDKLGVWNETDLCSIWIESGIVDDSENKVLIPPEVTINNFDISKVKYALEFPIDAETTVQLENPSKVPQRLYLTYMASYPNRLYPKMKVTIRGANSEERIGFYVDPFEDHGFPAHFPVLGGVGLMEPGKNYIKFKPMDSGTKFPFRLVGYSVSEVSLLEPGLTYSWL